MKPLSEVPHPAQNEIEEIMNEIEDLQKSPSSPEPEVTPPQEGCLSMTLTGNMTLQLKYECDSQMATISFKQGALVVLLKDGTEFKIPMNKPSYLRAVA